jgi:hypothetical protein
MREMSFGEYGQEIELAIQEWGIKEGLRLFAYDWPQTKLKTELLGPRGYFIDTGYKTLSMIYLISKETKDKISLAKATANQLSRLDDIEKPTSLKWPIKIMRTKNFITKAITPFTVNPLYEVLVSRGISLPFKGTLKQKDWQALPFEDDKGLKPVAI